MRVEYVVVFEVVDGGQRADLPARLMSLKGVVQFAQVDEHGGAMRKLEVELQRNRAAAARVEELRAEVDEIGEKPIVPVMVREGVAMVAVRLRACSTCKAVTTPRFRGYDPAVASLWGVQGVLFNEQARAAGWREIGLNGDCAECTRAKHARVKCLLCGEMREPDAAKEMFGIYGGSQEMACTACYEWVPAKRWNAVVQAAEEAHRYDYE